MSFSYTMQSVPVCQKKDKGISKGTCLKNKKC